jgi:aminoglycoside phosphotransferase (APT) family kinase protein
VTSPQNRPTGRFSSLDGQAHQDSPPGLPLELLTPWLSRHVPVLDSSAPLTARLLTGGRSNLTYEIVDAAGQRFALRRPPLGHVMPRAHDMAREYRVLAGLGAVNFAVPDVHALCEDETVMGVPFMLMGFVDGRVIADSADTATLTPEQADTVSATLIAGLAALHKVDIASAGLSDFGRPEGYLQRQVALWGRQWENTKTRDMPEIEALARWLAQHVAYLPTLLPTSLVHGDYRLDNVILDPGLRSLRAVLDWEMSTLGDPVTDLAITLVYWTESGDVLRRAVPVAQDLMSGPGFWSRERVIDEYASATGFDLSHLQFAVALACYKLAVIMESIHYRSRAGHQMGATTERNEDMGAAAEGLAALGVEVMSRGALEGLRA